MLWNTHCVSSQRNDASHITFLHYLKSPFREGSIKRPHIPALLPLGALRITRCGKMFLGCHGNKMHTVMWKVAQSCHDIKINLSATRVQSQLHCCMELQSWAFFFEALQKGCFFRSSLCGTLAQRSGYKRHLRKLMNNRGGNIWKSVAFYFISLYCCSLSLDEKPFCCLIGEWCCYLEHGTISQGGGKKTRERDVTPWGAVSVMGGLSNAPLSKLPSEQRVTAWD